MSDLRVCCKLHKCSLQLLRTFTSTIGPNNEHTFFKSRQKPVQVQMPVQALSNKAIAATQQPEIPKEKEYTKRVFSGIQPTGALHLGNYFGAIKQWTKMQQTEEHVSFCIVDLHSITLPQKPEELRDNITLLAATMLACGIDPEKSTIFVQSSVKEHSELSWILGTQCTVARLGHLPQYKEKSRFVKDVPLGLYLYPVLQAADITLYKTTHVPVGEDQVQHIQLAQHLAKTFNAKFGETFPICHAVVCKDASRIRSLRDPTKKMSKSDADARATINLMDEPDVILEKFKKALTDFTSDVTFEPETRPGVSNIVAIHALITDRSITEVLEEALHMDTGRYKLRVADAVAEHLKPIRTQIKQQLLRRTEISYVLEQGAQKARLLAAETMTEVYAKMGLGNNYAPVMSNYLRYNKIPATHEMFKQQQETAAMIDAYNNACAASDETCANAKAITEHDMAKLIDTLSAAEAAETKAEPMPSPTEDDTAKLVESLATDAAAQFATTPDTVVAPELVPSATEDNATQFMENPAKHDAEYCAANQVKN